MSNTPRYAAGTEVSVERSRAEIEKLLVRYGATGFQYVWEGDRSAIAFKMDDRFVRIFLPMPERTDPSITRTPTQGKRRGEIAQKNAFDAEVRRRWRALVLVVKAKLEAVSAGITTIEREFMSDVVLANNKTVGEWLEPQLKQMYGSGQMPTMLPPPPEEDD